MWGLLCRACMTAASDLVLKSRGKLADKWEKFHSMHPNSGDHKDVPTFDQNLKSQLKHFLNAVAVATNSVQQAMIASTSSFQQARQSCDLCLHLGKQEAQTRDTVGCKSFGQNSKFVQEIACSCQISRAHVNLLHVQLRYEVLATTSGCRMHLHCSVLLGCREKQVFCKGDRGGIFAAF